MNSIIIILLAAGFVFFTGGAVGILRMPDFYTRLHPAGMLDTMGIFLMVGGIALFNLHEISVETILLFIKIFLIVFFVFLSSPTATHSIVDAGMRAGLRHWTRKNQGR